jgi:1-aminocyclopropane-1-carboxylate deaminase
MAVTGLELLARELLQFWKRNGRGLPLTVCVPGGTCATALLLHHAIGRQLTATSPPESMDMQVVVIPCVGDVAYSSRQMANLNNQLGRPPHDIPAILNSYPNNREHPHHRFVFGKPDKLILDTFQWMKDSHDIVLDLMYGAPSWTLLELYWRQDHSERSQLDSLLAGNREVMLIHTGGVEGVESQLSRYKYEGLVAGNDIQLLGNCPLPMAK